jgi:hypothetical protein
MMRQRTVPGRPPRTRSATITTRTPTAPALSFSRRRLDNDALALDDLGFDTNHWPWTETVLEVPSASPSVPVATTEML